MKKERSTVGEILLNEFMIPLLAEELDTPIEYLEELIHNKGKISVEFAKKLSDHFGTTRKFWLNIQDNWEESIKSED